jgi:hypothetical protein
LLGIGDRSVELLVADQTAKCQVAEIR